MSALILDTNAYSRYRRGDSGAVAALAAADEIHLPLIVLGELLAGFATGGRPGRNRDDLARFMSAPRVHPMRLDEKTARHYADVFADLRRLATPIPTNDLWIAALARQHRLPVLSFDAHFASVPGVTMVPHG